MDRRRLGRALLATRLLIWTFSYCLFFTILAGGPRVPWHLAGWMVLGVVVGVTLSGVVQAIVWRSANMPHRFRLVIVVAVVLAVTFSNAVIDVLTLGQAMSPRGEQTLAFFVFSAAQSFSFLVWIHAFSAACAWLVGMHQDMLAKERRLAAAEAEAQKATLRALRAQVNPHFLFNALNATASLIAGRRNKEAEEIVLRLSDFFRSSLAGEPEATHALGDEFEILDAYLQVEQVRFSDRLSISLSCPPELEQASVPSLVLQPLVENAIKYAVAPSLQPTQVLVTARSPENRLLLSVVNEGAAPVHEVAPGAGRGLRNISERLELMFGDDAAMRAGPTTTGFCVELDLPLVARPAGEQQQ